MHDDRRSQFIKLKAVFLNLLIELQVHIHTVFHQVNLEIVCFQKLFELPDQLSALFSRDHHFET